MMLTSMFFSKFLLICLYFNSLKKNKSLRIGAGFYFPSLFKNTDPFL